MYVVNNSKIVLSYFPFILKLLLPIFIHIYMLLTIEFSTGDFVFRKKTPQRKWLFTPAEKEYTGVKMEFPERTI